MSIRECGSSRMSIKALRTSREGACNYVLMEQRFAKVFDMYIPEIYDIDIWNKSFPASQVLSGIEGISTKTS